MWWLSLIVGIAQSSCVLLYYQRAGDHIGWHYDYNFYQGCSFTVLLALHNRAAAGGLASGHLLYRQASGQPLAVETVSNVLVLFEGARVHHRVTPVAAGDSRVLLSCTYCTDLRLRRSQEIGRRLKDVGLWAACALGLGGRFLLISCRCVPMVSYGFACFLSLSEKIRFDNVLLHHPLRIEK